MYDRACAYSPMPNQREQGSVQRRWRGRGVTGGAPDCQLTSVHVTDTQLHVDVAVERHALRAPYRADRLVLELAGLVLAHHQVELTVLFLVEQHVMLAWHVRGFESRPSRYKIQKIQEYVLVLARMGYYSDNHTYK
jgi:hypothetical protein